MNGYDVRIIITALTAVVATLLMAGCAPTFLVTKDCYSAFLDSGDPKLHGMLCDTGDFSKILSNSDIPAPKKDALLNALCKEQSGEKVKEIYLSLSGSQKESLRYEFEKQGYDINYKPVEATGMARIMGLRENLPCPAQGYGY